MPSLIYGSGGFAAAAVIEASLRVHLPCSWVTVLTDRMKATVNVVEQKQLGDGLLQTFVEIEPGESDPSAIVEALQSNPDIVDVQAIVPQKGKILATLQVRACRACHTLAESECFLRDATATKAGALEWHILAPDRAAVKSLIATLKQRGLAVEIASIRSAKAAGLLTDRQQSVISLAYKLGFFEYPKKVNLTQLAKKLGVSKSTLSEIMRTGEAKILHAYFHGVMKKPR